MSSLGQLVVLLKQNNFKTDGFEAFLPGSPDEDTDVEHAFEVIIENQRGIKFLGIPLFSGKSLLPLIDPPMYQRLDGRKILLPHESMENYPLPDIDWVWSWSLWYVLMSNDVDELGWVYLVFWKPSSRWHGKYCVGDFVRRRLWVRRRHRKQVESNTVI